VPFSVLIGQMVGGVDIRTVGDANPGATNVARALGTGPFIMAALADYFKGVIPVGIAYWGLGFTDWRIVPIALAPAFGHAFSPFLRFKGGKAVAATLGTWTGLTWWVAPTLMGLLLWVWYTVLNVSGWAVMAMMLCFGGFVLLYFRSPALAGIWAGHLVLFAIKHRGDLKEQVGIRTAFMNRIRRWLGRPPLDTS
jgi:glycerol-3-phosphate acyltransferase PlsY